MTTPVYAQDYPVHVDAHLDPQLSRGLWLVKWLLVIPHYVVLAFLWLTFVVLSMMAFFAILFTGRYPRAVFDFNVGVLRWSWRVASYSYSALATDRYPPFSLREDPDYPAHLDVEYPQQLSRGLVLVKWWLLAIPHYLVVGIFVSGGIYLARSADDLGAGTSGGTPGIWDGGLIGLLVLIAAVALLFTGRYPRQLFDLVLGLNRWVLRVFAYASLMTDQYPPFRLDQGGDDPGGAVASLPSQPNPQPAATTGGTPPSTEAAPRTSWGAGRVVSVVLASLGALLSLGLLALGTTTAVANSTMRDHSGFLMGGDSQLSTGTYALTSRTIEIQGVGVAANMPHRMFGDAKVTATAHNGKRLFLGLADTDGVKAYLADVRHATVSGVYGHPNYRISGDRAPVIPPTRSGIWAAQSSGPGTQSLVAPVSSGHWTLVVMNADASAGIDTTMSFGATMPGLGTLTAVLLSVGGVLLVVSLVVVAVTVHGASRDVARPKNAPQEA